MKKKHQESYEKARRKRGKKVTIIKTYIIVLYTEKAKNQETERKQISSYTEKAKNKEKAIVCQSLTCFKNQLRLLRKNKFCKTLT